MLHHLRDIGQNSVIIGVKQQTCPPSPPPIQSLCTQFERNPGDVLRVMAPSVFTSKMNDIKYLFGILEANFQTN